MKYILVRLVFDVSASNLSDKDIKKLYTYNLKMLKFMKYMLF